MNNIINDNILLVMIAIAAIIIVIYRIAKNKEIHEKYEKKVTNLLTKEEYGVLKAKSENALNNTTISFTKQENNMQSKVPEEFYVNTILVGNKLIQEESFSISKVGKI